MPTSGKATSKRERERAAHAHALNDRIVLVDPRCRVSIQGGGRFGPYTLVVTRLNKAEVEAAVLSVCGVLRIPFHLEDNNDATH